MIQIKLTRKGKNKIRKLKAKYVDPNRQRIDKVTGTARTVVATGLGKLALTIAPKQEK